MLRGFVILIGVLIAILGLSQLILPSWWIGILPALMVAQTLRIIGIVVIVFGGILTLAALARAVGLRLLVLILGVLLLAVGILLLIDPAIYKNSLSAFLSTGGGARMIGIRVAGVIRMLIGIALIYAGRLGFVRVAAT